MVLRLSNLFVRTLREDPVDAEVASHKLLVRAGYIRRAAPGVYTWLPLGLKVLRKVENIIREEMDAIGAQEVHFPALLPREPYEATNRWDEYGDNLFRLKDRKGADMLLAPTHEEMFTLLVKDLYSSYKDLPVYLYQIQTKYRDEARPRAGLLRGREFVMKDSYSFNIDDEGLNEAYLAHRAAYQRIFERLGLEIVIVTAQSGAMGGSRSEEFLHPTPIGEDTFVRSAGGYAANVEAVTTVVPEEIEITEDTPAAVILDTPDSATIETLVERMNELHTEVTGGAEVEVEAASEEDLKAFPQLVKGYIGPGLSLDAPLLGAHSEDEDAVASATGIPFFVDPRVVRGTRWVTGANEEGKHVANLVFGRDFTADGVIEACEVREGDPAPDGSGELVAARGIEMGHIFALGRKYAEALGLKVLDQNGKLQTVTMGSYGVGVTRALAAIAEGNHDEKGLIWPRNLAPADIHIVVTGKDAASHEYAEELSASLESAGLQVMLDDRPKTSPGVKFGDAELLGVPTILVIGRGFKDGVLELKDRRSGEAREVSVENAVAEVIAEVKGA